MSKALYKLEKAKQRVRDATDKLCCAVQTAYPLDCYVKYSTSGYSALYQVVSHSAFDTRIRVRRIYVNEARATVRWLDGASDSVEWYGWGTIPAERRK